MPLSRRDFLKGSGALVVSFSASAHLGGAAVHNPFGTVPSHIDPAALDSWLALHADGSVTAFTGKCDLGQGIYTAQSQLVAEELCVNLQRVRLVQCDTALTPDQGSTSGSQSTPTNFNQVNLALAAATAREALLKMAAQHFGEPAEQLMVADGVIQARSGKRVRYEELIADRHFSLRLDPGAKRKPQSSWTVLGKPVPALEHPALMTASFEYVHHVRVPGMLHGRVVRPPQPGAALAAVDPSSVAQIAGLVQVVVRKDFVGVVAESQFAAVAAARQLQVTWHPGPALPDQARFFEDLPRQPSHAATELDSKDIAESLHRSHRVVAARYIWPFQSHGSLGTSCSVADVRPDGARVWSATQSVYPTRSCLAMILGLQPDQIRVIYTRGSGCYGLNGADAVSFDAAVLSQAVGRPVRLQYTRQDEMTSENYGNALLVQQRAGLDARGSITVWDRESWVPSLGNRPGYDRPGNIMSGALLGFQPEPLTAGGAQEKSGELHNGSNTVPEYVAGCIGETCAGSGLIQSERVLTHTVRAPFFTGPLRSPLRIQNTFANECFMDELSVVTGVDPVAFRLQHLREERLMAVLEAAATAAGWQSQKQAQESAAGKHILRGRGVACVAYEGRNGFAALVAEVDVNTATGHVQPRRFCLAIDCGPISNPDGLRNQIEGGLLQGTSRSLVEEITWDERGITSTDWETYDSLRLDFELPVIEMVFVQPPGVPATGAGETAITVVPAALGNAIFHATGVRLREVPFTPKRVLAALQQHHHTEAGVSV